MYIYIYIYIYLCKYLSEYKKIITYIYIHTHRQSGDFAPALSVRIDDLVEEGVKEDRRVTFGKPQSKGIYMYIFWILLKFDYGLIYFMAILFLTLSRFLNTIQF
jgi:hypothetical protein